MMDNSFKKKDILKNIIGSKGVVLGAPSASQTVKFQFATSIATAAASPTAGALTFAADNNGNAAIYAQGTLVSSKIQNVVAAAATDNKHGGKTVTVTYIGDGGSIQTSTFDVIDEAALEAYFTGSKTIDTSTGDIYEVKTDNATILVDSTKGLKTGLNIAYIAESGSTGATIALRDNNNNVLSSVEVSDIVGDGVLKDSIYHQDTNVLELRFGNGKVYNASDPSTYTAVSVDLQKLIDINDVFIGSDSTDYLDATLDSSTVTLNTKMKTMAEADYTEGAVVTGLADAADVKKYVDEKSTDLAVTASGDSYIDSSVNPAVDKKHVNVAAQIANLTVAKEGTANTTISGTSGKLIDAADAATKVSQYVDARLTETVETLDASIDSTPGTFVSVGVAEVDGKITNVVVHENIGQITGSASDLSGTAGLADAADIATAVKTYVDGQIDALDSSVSDKSADNYISIAVEATNGKLTGAEVDYTKSTVEFDNTPDALDLTATDGILTSDAISEIKDYVDAKSGALDSSVEDTDDGKGYVYVKTVQEDGALSQQIVNVNYGEITAAPGSITIEQNGVIDSSVLKEAVEGALVWTILP